MTTTSRSTPRYLRQLLPLVGATTIIILAGACTADRNPRSAPPVEVVESRPEIEPVLPRHAAVVGPLQAGIELRGQVRPRSVTTVAAPLSGIVDRSGTVQGQRVEAGETLLSILAPKPDDPAADTLRIAELELALAEATGADEGELDRLKSEVAAATRSLARSADTGAAAGAESVTDAGSVTDADVVAVLAPVSGVVVANDARVGAAVSEGQALVEIGDPDALVAVADAEPDLIERLQTGDPVTVAPAAVDRPAIAEGTVIEIDRGAGTVTVELPANIGVAIGRFVRFGRTVGTGAESVVVDRNAIRVRGELAHVIVEDKRGVTERRPVELGVTDGDDIEVVSGLAEGEVVLGS